MSTLSQVTAIVGFGPPYVIDGVVYTSTPTIDTDCLVFATAGPTVPGIAPGTTVRTVVPIATIRTMRGRNA